MGNKKGKLKKTLTWLKSFEKKGEFIFVLRLILGGFFLITSFSKVADIERYSVNAVLNFGILPEDFARFFGWVLPFLEMLCGFGLLLGVLVRLSAFGIASMTLIFFVTKVILLAQGRNIECGCFGAIVSTAISMTVYLDLPLMGLSLLIIFAVPDARSWKGMGKRLPQVWKNKLSWVW